MAERPEALVREAVVVAGLFFGREPDPAQLVRGGVGWHFHPVMTVHHLPVGASAAVGDPGSRAGAHDRLQRRHQAAGGSADRDPRLGPGVDIRLTVGDHDDLVTPELTMQDGFQRLGAPGDLLFRSEEHMSELQSLAYPVCRLLLENKTTSP